MIKMCLNSSVLLSNSDIDFGFPSILGKHNRDIIPVSSLFISHLSVCMFVVLT